MSLAICLLLCSADFSVKFSSIIYFKLTTLIKKILFIDDEPSLLEVAPLIFDTFDVHVTSEYDLIFDLIDKVEPDLIMLDILLGPTNGIDVCNSIKQNEKYSNIPVILMTAGFLPNKSKLCEADGFIEKPFNIEDAVAIVNMLTR
ncbi:response regulator [Pedobacter aquatilis]|uniref:response regulator n=1 Tax=Pedobacter aquatilis TaxID=351343 RepID=UPI0025B3D40E|nr:response regulator [Pedobacter aquatilis]MDN3585607.1 response regulator [Pedobacter aquatilis]